VADAVGEVAKAMPVHRSTKAIPNNKPWFLFIVTELEVDAVIFIMQTSH
jgi:hypothetical protein